MCASALPGIEAQKNEYTPSIWMSEEGILFPQKENRPFLVPANLKES